MQFPSVISVDSPVVSEIQIVGSEVQVIFQNDSFVTVPNLEECEISDLLEHPDHETVVAFLDRHIPREKWLSFLKGRR